MITVKDLIEQLQQLDPNLVVLTDGYEGGFREVQYDGTVVRFKKDSNDEWWYGPHEAITNPDIKEDFKGIIL